MCSVNTLDKRPPIWHRAATMELRTARTVLALALCACAPQNAERPPAQAQGSAKVGATAARAFREQHSNSGGMWLPTQMTLPQHASEFEKLGVELPAARLSNPLEAPLGAIVSLGGCTGSFVSDKGLLVTNHHCVQGALQYNSTPESNAVENGFLAKTPADEKSAGPAARVWVAQKITDVSKEMKDGLELVADPLARTKEREKREKALIAACEKDKPGTRCRVASFFRGDEYLLIESLELRDLRLVYAPQRSIGNYGGEIDNWAWPRHTGDFSFYRAYVGKDGKPAEYSPDNVPFTPKHHLKVATKGLEPSDFVMIAGYPGMTERTMTASEVQFDVEWSYPYSIAYYKQVYALLEELLKKGGDTAIKAGVAKQGVQNALEKYEGVLKGLTSTDALAQKRTLDEKVRAWAAASGREDKAAALAKLDKLIDDENKTARADFDRNQAVFGSRLLATAVGFVRLAEERQKPDAERKPGWQERDMPQRTAGQKQFLKAYDRTLDRARWELALRRALELPEAERAWLPTVLGLKAGTKLEAKSFDKVLAKALDGYYKATKLEDEATRLQLLQKATPAELAASKDPIVKAAVALWPLLKAKELEDDKAAGDRLLVARVYTEGMRAVLGGFVAPDANSTLRITYGTVKPVPAMAQSKPFTIGSEILAKNTGKDPFDAPKALLEALQQKRFGPYADSALGDLPVNYTSDLDITGGNSGSPTLNSKGELVGLAFDGTIEGTSSDVVFNPALNRTIHVDVRYMAWVMDAVDQADHVLKEMGITPAL